MCVIDHGENKWYVFDFKEAATDPWMVALPNVVNAVLLDAPHIPAGM